MFLGVVLERGWGLGAGGPLGLLVAPPGGLGEKKSSDMSALEELLQFV